MQKLRKPRNYRNALAEAGMDVVSLGYGKPGFVPRVRLQVKTPMTANQITEALDHLAWWAENTSAWITEQYD